jgi:exoribonuclease R
VPSPRVHLPPAAVPSWADLRRELEVVEEFAPAALAEAEEAARSPRLPAEDRTDLPLVTIDPPGSRDLDQALTLRRAGSGYVLHYAIADLTSFVVPGGALDEELLRRGETLYAPDLRVPLHPHVLGEGAASLLPDVDRPAAVWSFELDADGEPTSVDVRRAMVRSRARLDYGGVQAQLDDGTADEQLQLLREVGLLRQERARDRGAVDLPTPDQEVTDGPDGRPRLELRAPLPVEGWNAQISLLTGMAAARLMLDLGTGLLRTLPPPDPDDVAALRRSALALGVRWDDGEAYGDVVSRLDPAVPTEAALLALSTRLLRGSGYTAFDGTPPEQPLHSAVAAPYAHVTAPLRRLADRYATQVCLAACAGTPLPDDVRARLPQLPDVMTAADRRAAALERATVDLAEAVLLAPRAGEVFDAVVVEAGPKGGVVQLADPPVRGRCEGAGLPLGERVRVQLVAADPVRRSVLLRLAT